MSSIGGVTGDGYEQHRPVWIRLSLILSQSADKPTPEQLPHQDAINTTAEVPGILLHWLRAASGEWLALVTYHLPFADGRKQTAYLERQLVPAYALRPRTYGSHR